VYRRVVAFLFTRAEIFLKTLPVVKLCPAHLLDLIGRASQSEIAKHLTEVAYFHKVVMSNHLYVVLRNLQRNSTVNSISMYTFFSSEITILVTNSRYSNIISVLDFRF
jgi:hypothetical protein